MKPIHLFNFILLVVLLTGCVPGTPIAPTTTVAPTMPIASSTPSPTPAPAPTATLPPAEGDLSADEVATLNSLEQLDEYPLYMMRYEGAYPQPVLTSIDFRRAEGAPQAAPHIREAAWGCTLFAALGSQDDRLYGRNFDWRLSPALLLFTDPPDGYASVSMVDIEYLGFQGSRAKNLTDLPIHERQALLAAHALPFDGMNERGLAIGMAAVPSGGMDPDPSKQTIDQLGVMRAILDHAATVDEALEILAAYNIDMGTVPLHYLIASTAGDSALVEFYQGEMVVQRNAVPWQLATNFIVASTDGRPQGQCPRYDRVSRELQEKGGQIAVQDALSLLAAVAQPNTQWSIVYDLTGGEVHIVMGREYSGKVHTLPLSPSGQD